MKNKKTLLIFLCIILITTCIGLILNNKNRTDDEAPNKPLTGGKPVIYLYPEEETKINVKLKYDGDVFVTYPQYDINRGWDVIAYPNGNLICEKTKNEYSYLFWEGINSKSTYKMDKGFVVEGSKTVDFLQITLSKIGLTPKEYNEFIVYWLPQMINNKYNHIYFAEEEYTKNSVLDVNPLPDSVLRVFMVFKKLDKKINIEEQKINSFTRKGFTLIEWGGMEL